MEAAALLGADGLSLERLKAVAWKDLLEVRRDSKTLIAVTLSAWLLPLLALFTGSLQSATIVHVAIVDMDCRNVTVGNTTFSSSNIVFELAAGLRLAAGNMVRVEVYRCETPTTPPDVMVVVPHGFIENLTSYRTPAFLKVSYRPGSSAALNVYQVLVSLVIPAVSRLEAKKLVEALGAEAGLRINPDTVLNPVRVETGFIGVPVPVGERIAAEVAAARQLAFAIIFVLAPAAILTSDFMIVEKERRNLEMLFATPASPSEIVAGKMLAAGVVAGVAGMSDAASTLAYLAFTGLMQAKGVSLALIAVHVVSTMLAILVTCALTALAIMAGVSTRIASILSGVYTLIALFVYTASLSIDFTRLPLAYRAILSLIPYTYSVEAVIDAARMNAAGVALNLAALAAYTLLVVAAASKLANPERVVRSS